MFLTLSAFAAKHTFLTLTAASVAGATAIVAVDELSRNPIAYDKFGNAVKMGMGAMFTPVLLLEDGLRKAGMDIHEKGMLYNSEGKSISEIWHESVPAGIPEMKEVTQAKEIMAKMAQAKSVYEQSMRQIAEMRVV